MTWAHSWEMANPRTPEQKLVNFVAMIKDRALIENISEEEAEARYVAEMAEHPVA